MPEHQQYDSALKSLLGEEAAEIVPKILPESELVSEQNIEIDRTTLKADVVYNIKYKGEPHILNMELQTNEDADMHIRMLKYHVGLYDKHRLPDRNSISKLLRRNYACMTAYWNRTLLLRK